MYWEDTDRQIINGVTYCIRSNQRRREHVISKLHIASKRKNLFIFLGTFTSHAEVFYFWPCIGSLQQFFSVGLTMQCNAINKLNYIQWWNFVQCNDWGSGARTLDAGGALLLLLHEGRDGGARALAPAGAGWRGAGGPGHIGGTDTEHSTRPPPAITGGN